MRKLLAFTASLALVAAVAAYLVWTQERPVAHYLSDLRITLAVNEGVPADRGNLLGIQPELFPADYQSLERLHLKLAAYLQNARDQGLINDKTIVVLPEHIGTWLMLTGEKNEVYQAMHLKDAMNWMSVSNPLQFARAWISASGSDRLAEACELLGLAGGDIVVNVQGDEPLIEPALIDAVATLLTQRPEAAMGTAAHPIASAQDLASPNVVKVVTDAQGLASYFSRAPIPFARDHAAGSAWWQAGGVPAGFAPLRHIGIYSYRVGFLRGFPQLAPAPTEQLEQLEQLRALWHGYRIAVHISPQAPGAGVDTPEDLERVRALLAPAG